MIPSLMEKISAALIETMTSLMSRLMLLLYEACKQFIFPHLSYRFMLLNLIVIILGIFYCISSSRRTEQSPLFSFPSFAQPLISAPSFSLPQAPLASFHSLTQSLASLPSFSLQTIKLGAKPFQKKFALPEKVVPSAPPLPKPDVMRLDDSPSEPDVVILDRSPSYPDVDEASDEEESKSMEDTWKAIFSSGGVKPVKLRKSEEEDRVLERVDMVNSSVTGRKKDRAQMVRRELRIADREMQW